MAYYDTGIFAVFDTLGVDNTRLNAFLWDNINNGPEDACLWMADTYEDLERHQEQSEVGMFPPVNTQWRSPWVGKTFDDVLMSMRNLSEKHNLIDHYYFVMIDDSLLTQGTVWWYRIEGQDDEEEQAEDEGAAGREVSVTRFASPASEALAEVLVMQSGDWEQRLTDRPPGVHHPDADWWARAGEDIEAVSDGLQHLEVA